MTHKAGQTDISRFAPLTQVDTVEDVPSTVASTVAPTAAVEGEHVRPTVRESDTETVASVAGSGEATDDDGLSDVEDMHHSLLGEVTSGLEEISASAATFAAMATLGAVDLSEVLSVRARVFKCPPAFLKGAFRSCLRIALQEAECGRAESNGRLPTTMWYGAPFFGEVIVGLEEISASAATRAAMATLDAVDFFRSVLSAR